MTSTSEAAAALSARLDDLVRLDESLLVEMRRDLHAHPELSGRETATTAWLGQHLRDLGLGPVRLDIGTGLVCDVPVGGAVAGDGSPVVALRADIDALAMQDDKRVGYRSQHDGAAHACGHDVHTTVLVGAARALRALAADVPTPGVVRLVFEPSEEAGPGGAVDVIAEGWLDGVSAIFGLHCDPKVDVGRIGCRPGALTSASDTVEVRVSGPGGHTARPELTVDLVAVLGRLVTGLQHELDRLTERPADLRVVFGAVHAGDAGNVIPATGTLRGSVRTRDRELWRHTPDLVRRAVGTVLHGSSVSWDVEHVRGVPPVLNDVAMNDLLAGAARRVLGADGVVATDQSLGGDSFAWYLEKVPGVYARLGVHDPASTAPRLDLHASTFDVDERAIGVGVRVLVTAALDALAR